METSGKPCSVKWCPAIRIAMSGWGYCSIHHAVASNPELFAKALKGHLTPGLREFALECERGYYHYYNK